MRGLIAGQDQEDLADTAQRLGIEELSLRLSIDEESPHPTIEVLAAVIRVYGVDPSWLLTGTYDPATHRVAMEDDERLTQVLRNFMSPRPVRISEPAHESFRLNDQN